MPSNSKAKLQYEARARRLKKKRMTYAEYLKSPHWEKTKQIFFHNRKKECVLCKSTERIVVHHLSYVYMFRRRYRTKDLVCVCQPCHDMMHNAAIANNWGLKQTFKIFKNNKQMYNENNNL